ncbi:MAG: biopolymer transporter ExbD [Planctomycetia bacterium]|nr:biopolymer transporter ExbD [Planctomycetia bacterium]
MRLPKNKDRGSLEFNMTPMIDVTFQLIIFFLVSSHLAKQETLVELDLPSAESGVETLEEDAHRRFTVNVTLDGGLVVAGESLDESQLGRRLAAQRAKNDKLEVRIRSDRQVEYGRVKPILKECLKNDVWKVTFAVMKQGP